MKTSDTTLPGETDSEGMPVPTTPYRAQPDPEPPMPRIVEPVSPDVPATEPGKTEPPRNVEPKKDEPKKEIKTDEPKKDVKKDEPKKDNTKKDSKKTDTSKTGALNIDDFDAPVPASPKKSDK